MSFFGTVSDSNMRQKHNRGMLIDKRKNLARIKQLYLNSPHNPRPGVPDKDIPPEVLAEIRAGIKKQLRKEKRRQIVWDVVLVILVVSAVIAVFAYLKLYRVGG